MVECTSPKHVCMHIVGPASRTQVVAKAEVPSEVASEVSSKEENHLDGVHKAPLDGGKALAT